MAKHYTIQQAAAITQVSAHTLRYYERIGLLQVARAENGHRRYTEDDLGWVRFILLLRDTDMSLPDIAAFMRLEKHGRDTIDKRRIMLQAHRETLLQHIEKLQNHLDALENKIDYYSEVNDDLLDCVQQDTPQTHTQENP